MTVLDYTYEELRRDCRILSDKILAGGPPPSIYGVPRGGGYVALALCPHLNVPVLDEPDGDSLIVDDIVDSGATIEPYIRSGRSTASLFVKPHASVFPNYQLHVTDRWVRFPWERKGESIEDNLIRILQMIGENPNREGLVETPNRVAKMYREVFRGYRSEEKPKLTVFPNGKDGVRYDEMIYDTGRFYSFCEHHILPFFGRYSFAYIPEDKIIGLSKIARLIEWHAAKLQIQERLVKEVLDDLVGEIKPLGIGLVVKGRHLCKEMRGTRNSGEMITSDLRGRFRDNPATRAEFFSLINAGSLAGTGGYP